MGCCFFFYQFKRQAIVVVARLPKSTPLKVMTGFPEVPRFRGDTDEDASIHLYNTVGKAKPLRSSISKPYYSTIQNSSMSIDDRISNVLNEHDDRYSNYDDEIDEDYTNHTYLKFLNGEYGEEDEVEEGVLNDYDYEYQGGNETDSDTYRDEGGNILNGYNEGFVSGDFDLDEDDPEDLDYIPIVNHQRKEIINGNGTMDETKYHDANSDEYEEEEEEEEEEYLSEEDTPVVFDSIKHAKSQISRGSESVEKHKNPTFNWKLGIVIAVLSFLITIVIGYVSVNGLDGITLPDFSFVEPLRIAKLDGRLQRLEQDLKKSQNDKHDILLQVQYEMNQLNEKINGKLEQLGKSNDIIQLKNNKIQITPEFHQFLYNFIDNYQSSYIDSKLEGIENLNDINRLREYVDTSVQNSVDSIKQEISLEYDELMNNLTVSNGSIGSPNNNKIWLDSVLGLISRGSTLVNYADYSSGSRILGFLTTVNKEESSTDYNVLQKMIYGWWIYNERMTNDKYNANHVILDDDIFWKGGDEIGIRMSSCIIPTDIIIECECELEKDQYVTIGFKPSTKTGFDKLPYGKFNKDANKYTTKFKKIRQAKIKSGINHVRLPIRFINEKIGGKDVYFKFNKNLDINNIKIYGISEVNAVKYQDKLNLLVEKFNEAINEEELVENLSESNSHNKNHITQIDLNDDIYL